MFRSVSPLLTVPRPTPHAPSLPPAPPAGPGRRRPQRPPHLAGPRGGGSRRGRRRRPAGTPSALCFVDGRRRACPFSLLECRSVKRACEAVSGGRRGRVRSPEMAACALLFQSIRARTLVCALSTCSSPFHFPHAAAKRDTIRGPPHTQAHTDTEHPLSPLSLSLPPPCSTPTTARRTVRDGSQPHQVCVQAGLVRARLRAAPGGEQGGYGLYEALVVLQELTG